MLHLDACEVPWWMLYVPYLPLIPSMFFQASLEPHKNQRAVTNMILVQPSAGLCRVPLFLNNSFCGYPFFSSLLHLLPHYHNVSCVKFLHEHAFVAPFPVSKSPLREQDVEYLSFSKYKCLCSVKLSQFCFTSGVPSLDLSGDWSIGNGKSLTISTTD